jgi:thiamine monophosphate kinase
LSSEELIVPTPSGAALLRLAGIAAHAGDLLAVDNQMGKAPVGLTTIKNDRRRTMEAILLLLADPEVRNYLAELERLGLLPQ